MIVGVVTRSLRHLVRREVRRWKRDNEAYRRLSGSRTQRFIFQQSRRLLRFWTVLGASIIVIFSLAQLPVTMGWVDASGFFHFSENIVERLLTIQLAIVGFIYATIFAVIGLVLQRGFSDLRVRVFLSYSVGLLCGSSGVVLAMLLVLSLEFATILLSPFLAALADITLVIWFFVNLLLTVYFLIQTLRYLSPLAQQQALLSYLAITLWPEELKKRLMDTRFRHSPDGSWPPELHDENNTYLNLERFDYDPVVEISLPRHQQHFIKNVWLRPLGYIIRRWSRRAASKDPRNRSTLHLPLFFQSAMSASSICLRSGNTPLTRLERIIIKLSIRRTWRPTRMRVPDVVSVMDELGTHVLDTIGTSSNQSFDQALQHLLKYHRTLVALGLIGAEPSENYLTARNEVTGSMQTLNQRLLKPYREISSRAASLSNSNPAIFDSFAYAPISLLSHTQNQASRAMRENFLYLATRNWNVLLADRARVRATAGDNAARNLKLITTLCGVWDSSAFCILPRKRPAIPWASYSETGLECMHHLESTASLIFTAVKEKDFVAARWAVDLLQRWVDYWDVMDHSGWKQFPLLDSMIFHSKWDLVERKLGIRGESLRSTLEKQQEVFAEALLNEWHTTVAFVWMWLVAQGREASPDQKNLLSLAGALRAGQVMEGSGTRHAIVRPYEIFDDVFGVWARTTLNSTRSSRWDNGLWGRLAEASKDSVRIPWVAGRVYGNDEDENTVNLAEIVQLHLLAHAGTSPTIGEPVSSNLIDYCNAETGNYARLVKRMTEGQSAIVALDVSRWTHALSIISPSDAVLEESQTSLAEEVRKLLVRIETRHDKRLSQSPIDQKKIDQIEQWCGQAAFDPDRGALPLPYFDSVELVDEVFPDTPLRLQDRSKAELVDPPLATSVSNEGVSYPTLTQRYVSVDLVSKIEALISPTEHHVSSASEFAALLQDAEKRLRTTGLDPLLILARKRDAHLRWLQDSREAVPEDHPIVFETLEGFVEPGYMGHLNGIPAIQMPIQSDTALLMPRECFAKAMFTRKANGQPVALQATEIENYKVRLEIAWSVKIVLADTLPAWRFLLH